MFLGSRTLACERGSTRASRLKVRLPSRESLQHNSLKRQSTLWKTAHMDPWSLDQSAAGSFACAVIIQEMDHTLRSFSSTWFSRRAYWVSLLTLHITWRRMFSLCDSESASAFLYTVALLPLLCATLSPHPCHLTSFSCLFFSQWHHGRFKSGLFKEARSFSNSLITWHSVQASWLCRYSHPSSRPDVISVN